MADVVDVVAKADFVAAQKEISDLRDRLTQANEAQVKERIAIAEKAVAAKEDEVKAAKLETENVKASKKELETELSTVKASLEDSNKKLQAALAEIEEGKKVAVRANRISTLVDIGVEKVEAEKLVDASAGADDNLFKVIVETQAKVIEAQKAAAAWKPEEKKDDKKKKEKEAAKADEQKLENAEASKDAALAADESSEADSTMAGLADFLSHALAAKNK